jgi:nitrile hydratase
MDGAHDLGGRQGFGPVVVEPYKRHYHARWEAATRLLFRVILPQHLPNGSDGALRHAIERMDAVRYLTSSYYERWVTAAATLAVESGIVTHAELEERAGGPYPLSRPVTAETITNPQTGLARFAVGDRVRVRGWHPRGHTRCPWYVRGHLGVVTRRDGAFSLPDVEAHSQHRVHEPTYSVRFDADELWNDGQAGVTVNVDLWDSYLEPA